MTVVASPLRTTIRTLARQAREGDADAALELARREHGLSFPAFVARHVPQGAMTRELFDVLCDAYDRAAQEAAVVQLREQVPLPDDLNPPEKESA